MLEVVANVELKVIVMIEKYVEIPENKVALKEEQVKKGEVVSTRNRRK